MRENSSEHGLEILQEKFLSETVGLILWSGFERISNKVSFDALEEDEQNVFLDIACCFKGCELTWVEDLSYRLIGGVVLLWHYMTW
jgi:hypothetical protein